MERSFYRERFKYTQNDDESPQSGLESTAQHSTETLESDEFYPKCTPLELTRPWQYDKSDLDSVDSNYFKHSLHQQSCEEISDKSLNQNYVKEEFQLAETTTSDSSENYSVIKKDEILLSEELISIEANPYKINTDTIIKKSHKNDDEKLIIELKGDNNSVISYDSIYLSSEGTFTEEKIEIEEETSITKIKEKIADSEETVKNEVSIDTLYSQVKKTKPKIIALEPKQPKLTTFSDFSICGTLEKLTFITSSPSQTNNTSKKLISTEPYVKNLIDHQYYSLPDVNIGKSLLASERIDAKLRQICENEEEETKKSIYDSISRFGRAHKKLRQRESCEVIVLKPHSIADEQPKEAPSIEVEPPNLKEINNQNKLVKELGLDTENCNLFETFNNFSEHEISIPPNTIKIGGKQVIVDEVAAKGLNKTCKLYKREETIKNQLFTKKTEEKEESDLVIPPHRSKEKSINHPEIKIVVTDTSKEEPLQTKKENKYIKFNVKTKEESIYDVPEKFIFKAKPVLTSYHNQYEKIVPKKELITRSLTDLNLIKKYDKMSRPQILHIVDSKKTTDKINLKELKTGLNESPSNENEQEFHEKVDSVRTYWTKLVGDNEKMSEASDSELPTKEFKSTDEIDNKYDSIEENFQSFCPTVEIVEKQSSQSQKNENSNEADFDHVRYKIMRSDMFQKNLFVRDKKEAQFDGLMQYLQDYSFQELLAQNNIVIIEPVRTKIEQISEKPLKNHRLSCKITGGAGESNSESKSNLKKHFFYHPVRVNKELLDEELPTPDTVRNVRKLFEGTLRLRKPEDIISKNMTDDLKICGQHKNLKKRALRYLTIDTSFVESNVIKKWDSSSLSSGISSGDLSSPCECGENSRFSSEENLCDDELCESQFVSQVNNYLVICNLVANMSS